MDARTALGIITILLFLGAGLWGLRYPTSTGPRVHCGWIGMGLLTALLLFVK